jgi:hypothetical protein
MRDPIATFIRLTSQAGNGGQIQLLDMGKLRSQSIIENDFAAVSQAETLEVRTTLDDGQQLLGCNVTHDNSQTT